MITKDIAIAALVRAFSNITLQAYLKHTTT